MDDWTPQHLTIGRIVGHPDGAAFPRTRTQRRAPGPILISA